jgi:hypothetical protein
MLFGRVSRERLARHIVDLVAHQRRALFISRIYEVPVWTNKLLPEVVDWVSAAWVRRKRKSEVPTAHEVAPVRYPGSLSVWHALGGLVLVSLLRQLWRKRR